MRKEHCKIVRRKCKTRRAKREFGPTDVVDTHLKHIALVLVLMNMSLIKVAVQHSFF